MAKLLIHETNGIREFELMDEEVHIGRELDNTLRIADPSVSRHHAVLRRTPNGYVLEDKKSSNGVVINYVRVDEATIKDGDQFSLGHIQITFQDNDSIRIADSSAVSDNTVGTA